MGIADGFARQFLNRALVISKIELSKNIFHLTVKGQDLMDMNYIPGQNLRIFVGMGVNSGLKDKIRTYSIWQYEKNSGTIDIVVCAHTEGPGSKWIKSLLVGQEVYLSTPKGKFIVDPSATNYLFIGDDTTLAHFYEIRRNLPAGKDIKGILYAEHSSALFSDIDNSSPFEFYELPENPQQQLINLIENTLIDNTNTIVYIGGDGRVCVGLNKYLKKVKGLSTKNIKTKPFWMPGKFGLE